MEIKWKRESRNQLHQNIGKQYWHVMMWSTLVNQWSTNLRIRPTQHPGRDRRHALCVWGHIGHIVEDVDEDEEECYEHCHPESESEIMHQRPQKILWKIAVPFSLKMKLLSFWINAVVI